MNAELIGGFPLVSLWHKVFLRIFLLACLWTGFLVFGYAQYSAAVSTGRLTSSEIREASGLVASLTHPGYLWTHNDSGDAARIFLLDSLARHRGTWYLQGVFAQDWEEIGRMSRGGVEHLIVGDIGDNRARRDFVTIRVFPEPNLPVSVGSSDFPGLYIDSIGPEQIHTLHLRYEDGPRDAEAFFYDDQDERLYIITKRELQVGIYSTPLPEILLPASAPIHPEIPTQTDPTLPPDTLLLRRQAVLPITWITAADISPDGSEILIKNLLEVFHWHRKSGESVLTAVSRSATPLVYDPEPQGEAITFRSDGTGYYTLSEQVLGLPVYLKYAEKTKR